jgi:hypothetical protein
LIQALFRPIEAACPFDRSQGSTLDHGLP